MMTKWVIRVIFPTLLTVPLAFRTLLNVSFFWGGLGHGHHHCRCFCVRSLPFLFASENFDMVFVEVAAVLGGLGELFMYNRETYQYNRELNQERIFQLQKLRVNQVSP